MRQTEPLRESCARPGTPGTAALLFARAESGSMVILGLFLMMALLLIGGISVDLMRVEYERLRMQAVLDSAVLAATDLDQVLDPEAVVRDYVAKADLAGELTQVQAVSALDARDVAASGTISMPTMFVRAIGFDTLDVGVRSRAREAIGNIEVSLVLDVSGSMDNYGRLTNMKLAAKEFVQTLMGNAVVGALPVLGSGSGPQVSISIVPYATQVAAGADMLSQFTLERANPDTTCLDFPAASFSTTTVDLATPYVQTGSFDPFTRSAPPRIPVCRTDAAFRITPLSNSQTALNAQIDALTASGNTSIDLGVKWGAALLDPTMQPVVRSLIADGKVDPIFDGRPHGPENRNTMKVLVVMTDGENTRQYQLNPGYDEELSDVWGVREVSLWGGERWKYSVRSTEPGDRDGDGRSNEEWYIPRTDRWSRNIDGGNANAVQLTYRQLWKLMSVSYNAYNNWYRQTNSASLYYEWINGPLQRIEAAEKDARLSSICRAAKDKGILVFGIGFEITAENARIMRDCASSENHYYDVEGLQIVTAFSSIARTINQLRLVQ